RAEAPPALVTTAIVEEALHWLPGARAGEAPGASAAPGRGEGPPERILLAEDNADMRAYLGRLLGRRWAVIPAADGHAAWEEIVRAPPDLVLADVMMPGL